MRYGIILVLIFWWVGTYSQSKEDKKIIKSLAKAKVANSFLKFEKGYKTNERINFSIVVETKKGEIEIKGPLIKDCFEISGDVSINNTGHLELNSSSKSSFRNIEFLLKSKQNDEIKIDTFITPNYKGRLILDYSGNTGESGIDGAEIKSEIGQVGKEGGVGHKGSNGHELIVDVSLNSIEGIKEDLIMVHVNDRTQNKIDTFYVSPTNSTIIIKSNGGKGGRGGRGGSGGKGSPKQATNFSMDSNGRKTPIGSGYPGGFGGNGGRGGYGGNCGKITVKFYDEADKFKSIFEVEMMPGEGGDGGPPGPRGRRGDLIYNNRRIPFDGIEKLNKSKSFELFGNEGVAGDCESAPKIININAKK